MIYKILEADTAEGLGIEINQKLAAGWELYGNLVTAIKADTSEEAERDCICCGR